ncbi:MAG: AI-2E family transporter [Verrucomicrobia bacterium]|nr:AI-2E family transporter [Verrucomicrobiota bacterium]
MSRPTRISFGFMAGLLVVVAVMGLATPLLTVLFSFFLLHVFSFKGRSKSLAVALLLVAVAAVCLGVMIFLARTFVAAPEIGERLIPKLADYARGWNFELPFKDLQGLMALVKIEALERFGLVGILGTNLLRQVAFVVIGMVVAISLFDNAAIVIDRDKHTVKNNLYSITADEIGRRFELFYKSFHTVMGAQIIISSINTIFTGIFLFAVGFPYWHLLIVVTFLCGLLPILGNILSNTLIVCVGLTVDPQHAVGALAFLMIVHKCEYFLNSKIIGKRIQNPMWMTLLGLILGERLMGVPGMILAPVILHYIKMETSRVAVEHKAEEEQPLAEQSPE